MRRALSLVPLLALLTCLTLQRAGGDTRRPPPPPPPPHVTQDGRLTVPELPGGVWDCEEHSGQGEPLPVNYVRCFRRDWGEGFALMAKEYSVPPQETRSAEELSNEVYRAQYAQAFRDLRVRRRGAAAHQQTTGYEVEMDAVAPPGVPLRILERVIVKGRRVLSLQASGPIGQYRQATEAIRLWFGETRFAALEPRTLWL